MSIWDPQNPQTFGDTVKAIGVRFFDTTYLRTPAGMTLKSTQGSDGNFEDVLLDASFLNGNTAFEMAYAEAMAAVKAAEESIEIKASPAAAVWLILTGKDRHLLLNIMNCNVSNAEMLMISRHNGKRYCLRVGRNVIEPFSV